MSSGLNGSTVHHERTQRGGRLPRRRHAGGSPVAQPGSPCGPVVLRRQAGLSPGDDLSRRQSGGGGRDGPRAAHQAGARRAGATRHDSPAVRAPGPVRRGRDRADRPQRNANRDPPRRPCVRAAPDPSRPGGAADAGERRVGRRPRRHAVPRPGSGTPRRGRDRLAHPHSRGRPGAGHGALPHHHLSAHLLLPRLVRPGLRGPGSPRSAWRRETVSSSRRKSDIGCWSRRTTAR